MDYAIYLDDGNIIIVNAEESPGDFESSEYIVNEWGFDVDINIIEKTGLTSIERLKMLGHNEMKVREQERIRRYKALLVCYWKENVSAGLFWKKVVEEYTNEHYHICGTESSHNCGFTFEN